MTAIYSVIIPLKNEAENLCELLAELELSMEKLHASWEVICIDDGSTDDTPLLLQMLVKTKPYLRVITFNKNYGQSSAFDAGFRTAKGEFLISLDGDRQNDPADIPSLVSLIHDCDLVCGIRLKRKDSLLKRVLSKGANLIRSRLCQDGMQDTGCSLKVYRKACFDQIKMYQGMHRFLPALFVIEGFRVKQFPVNHRERKKGKSNYTLFNRSLNTVFDLLAVRWMRKRHLRHQIDLERSHF